jgi:hypothetical protein
LISTAISVIPQTVLTTVTPSVQPSVTSLIGTNVYTITYVYPGGTSVKVTSALHTSIVTVTPTLASMNAVVQTLVHNHTRTIILTESISSTLTLTSRVTLAVLPTTTMVKTTTDADINILAVTRTVNGRASVFTSTHFVTDQIIITIVPNNEVETTVIKPSVVTANNLDSTIATSTKPAITVVPLTKTVHGQGTIVSSTRLIYSQVIVTVMAEPETTQPSRTVNAANIPTATVSSVVTIVETRYPGCIMKCRRGRRCAFPGWFKSEEYEEGVCVLPGIMSYLNQSQQVSPFHYDDTFDGEDEDEWAWIWGKQRKRHCGRLPPRTRLVAPTSIPVVNINQGSSNQKCFPPCSFGYHCVAVSLNSASGNLISARCLKV